MMRLWPTVDMSKLLAGQAVIAARLDALRSDIGILQAAVGALSKKVDPIMSALDDLKAADAKLGTSVANAVATMNGDTTKLADLAAKLSAAAPSDDSSELAALAADLSTKAAALDAAVNPVPAPAAAS